MRAIKVKTIIALALMVFFVSDTTTLSASASSPAKLQQTSFNMNALDNAQTKPSGDSFLNSSTSSSSMTITTPILIKPQWEVLGPFPTGMREQDFGADPLEAFGKHNSNREGVTTLQ